MNKKLYIADWHYDHKNVIRYDNRPFLSVEEMNQKLVELWNGAVDDTDEVYVLGDMFWCNQEKAISVLEQLRGKKYLVLGNHDKYNNANFVKQFADVSKQMNIQDDGRPVFLYHFPVPCFDKHYYGAYHLYGHVHNSFEWNMMESIRREMIALYDKPCNMYNVGAMMPYIRYVPRTLDEIISGYEKTLCSDA